MTSATPADDILKAFSELQLSTYIFMSGTAFLVTDWFFTLDLEVQYAWNGTWNIGRILFFLTRYSPFFELALRMYCK
ncbi:hypothetical protein BDZ94DRAFT_389547 [Collybia nuda]|uniref:DUF6533 domain-containing protein n=1 Tax=Collybia nuda TaxID=64659 RepID=A0A9P5YAV2_9AGAR|nr:hypothetical protein BDZ94DRAFT_389547 [Collybia nuda]